MQDNTGTLGNGDNLPSWIQVNPDSGAVTVGDPPSEQNEVVVRVQAVAGDGTVRVLSLKLDLDDLLERLKATDSDEPVTQGGFQSLSDQLAAQVAERDHYGTRLMQLFAAS